MLLILIIYINLSKLSYTCGISLVLAVVGVTQQPHLPFLLMLMVNVFIAELLIMK